MSAPIGQARDVRLLLLDSASLYWRAFHALPDSIVGPTGQPVNAVRGFFDTVAKLIADRSPDRVVACWDDDWRPAWRVDLVPSYKAHRVESVADEASVDDEAQPDLLSPQIPVIAQICEALGIDVVGAPECEADDVIAALALGSSASGDEVDIASGDRDLVQLVDQRVSVLYTGGTAKSRGGAPWLVLDPAAVEERFDVAPADYPTLATLRGDPSDGLPGVPGIGQRTAVALIARHGSLDNIIAAAHHPGEAPMTTRIAGLLRDHAEQAQRTYQVVRLTDRCAVGDLPPRRHPQDEAIAGLIDQYGLRSVILRVRDALAPDQGAEE